MDMNWHISDHEQCYINFINLLCILYVSVLHFVAVECSGFNIEIFFFCHYLSIHHLYSPPPSQYYFQEAMKWGISYRKHIKTVYIMFYVYQFHVKHWILLFLTYDVTLWNIKFKMSKSDIKMWFFFKFIGSLLFVKKYWNGGWLLLATFSSHNRLRLSCDIVCGMNCIETMKRTYMVVFWVAQHCNRSTNS